MYIHPLKIRKHSSRYSRRLRQKLVSVLKRQLQDSRLVLNMHLWLKNPMALDFARVNGLQSEILECEAAYDKWIKLVAKILSSPISRPMDYTGIGRRLLVVSEVAPETLGPGGTYDL